LSVEPIGVPIRPARKKNARPALNRIDQALLHAKNEGFKVTFTLAVETPYTDDDYSVSGLVLEVDKYDIKLDIDADVLNYRREVWFKRSAIVATRIHKS
jgi:hypothetical protein